MRKEILELLKRREFISIASADRDGKPNCAPKFFFKVEGNSIYVIDYSMGRTARNIKANPRASMSIMDIDNLVSYQLNGRAELIELQMVDHAMLKEIRKKLLQLSAARVIEGVRTGKRYEHYELELPDRYFIIRIKIDEIVQIGQKGELLREEL